ncbi:Cytochrome P450 78A3 [Acorus gramineus]|uniref:Cytochrome P450 78A3 n=1 Tax=Acorus gramineus TaxID=55184 RepID=A0AAV9A2S1_ACOGR|nr:Cytochrome P450 78A3 [Acorus gramineus]
METTIESWWALPLAAAASKCGVSSPLNLLSFSLLLMLSWLATVFLHWAHQGGPAWGKHWLGRPRDAGSQPIPGPRGFPVVGAMGLMAGLAHRHLADAADRLGARRLMAFSLGETRVIVASHQDVAREILNRSAFADRPIKETAYGLMFHRAIGFAPYGAYWRKLRTIAATHLFCPRQIVGSEARRLEIAADMVEALARRLSDGGGGFRVREILKRASLNNIMGSVFGKKYELFGESEEVRELRGLVDEGYELLGKLNWSDHLPVLAGLDLQRIRYRCSRLVPRVKRFVNRIIDEHLGRTGTGKQTGDFVDILLSLHGSEKLSDLDMVAVLWEMIFRGTDTVAVLIEWVLARLILHPNVQAKAQAELDLVVGRSRPVAEADVAKLTYTQGVIKEVLRMHPPGPLLSWARLATSDTTVDGWHVPAGTTAMVNMWAIMRDPHVWVQPEEFAPERFLSEGGAKATVEMEFSVLGSDLRIAPFGSGRRSCPGKALALTTVGFWVATLLHEYTWRASDGVAVDLTEVLRLSCEMASPLTVTVCSRRGL